MLMVNRLSLLAATPSLQLTWQNYDGTATIYLTTDPTLNQITLTLTNNLGGGNSITFPPGKPEAYGHLPTGDSAIYLFFDGLLSNADIQAINWAADGWSPGTYTDENDFQYLVLAPNDTVNLANGASLVFLLTNVLASGSPVPGSLLLSLCGVTGLPPGQANPQVYVNVANPPVKNDQALNLVMGFAENNLVLTGGQQNELILYLTNPNSQPLVPGGSTSWGTNPPTFQLTLVYGSDAGSLTTASDAANITVDILNAFGNVWNPVQASTQGVNPYWIMQPNSNGGGTVLGTGSNASMAFSISNIVTTLPQGLTFAYLSYANIPGYNDGFYALEIVKVAPISIQFTATPSSITNAVSGTQVTLEFEVQNASYVTITNTSYAQATTSADFTGSITVTVYATTVFTLIATNANTGETLAAPVEVTVSPDPFHLVPTGTIVMWSGCDIPTGWSLCDGGNNTPNLIGKFILGGYNGTNNPLYPGNAGGSASHTHQANVNVAVQSAGEHEHTVNGIGASSKQYVTYTNTYTSTGLTVVTSIGDGLATPSGQHSHTATATAVVESASNMPPWYALCFIMKTS